MPAVSSTRDDMLLDEGAALRRLARSLLRPADVDDVVQQTLATALGDPHAGGGHLRPWLRATLRKLAATLRRADARRAARERLVAAPEAQVATDPVRIAEQAELIRAVGDAVHGLHEPLRTVVVMRFWRGMLPEAIARELAVPRNTVRSQLQRGVALLRARLDTKFGTRERWAAPLGMLVGARAAVPAAVTGGGVLLFAGMLMKTKLLLGAGAVLLAAVAIPCWTDIATAPSHTPGKLEPGLASQTAGSPPDALQRVEISTPRPEASVGVAEPAPPSHPPWLARFVVVDTEGAPMADAAITVWAASRDPARRTNVSAGHGFSGHDPDPLVLLRTDDSGVACTNSTLECLVARATHGELESNEVYTWRGEGTDLTRIVVERFLRQRGVVLQADGSPAAAAEVTFSFNGGSLHNGVPCAPAPQTADASGEFSVLIPRGAVFTARARYRAQRTLPETFTGSEAQLLRLTLPGGLTLEGTVCDDAGQPVPGARVTAWLQVDADEARLLGNCEQESATSDPRGRFCIPVRHLARYQLVASCEGHGNSQVSWAATTTEYPHAVVRLMLSRLTDIRGTVLRPDGSPWPGIQILACAEQGPRFSSLAGPGRRDLFARAAAVDTDAAGRFVIVVDPGSSCSIVAKDGSRSIELQGVAPGRTDLLIRFTDGDLEGCIVDGTVKRADDAAPKSLFQVQQLRYQDGELVSCRELEFARRGNAFRTEPLPLGQACTFVIRPAVAGTELAPVCLGPFTTSAAGIHLEVRLPVWGCLPVRIVCADGKPAGAGLTIRLEAPRVPLSQIGTKIGDDGLARLTRCVPDASRLEVRRQGELLLQQELVVQPGLNPEFVVRLRADTNEQPR